MRKYFFIFLLLVILSTVPLFAETFEMKSNLAIQPNLCNRKSFGIIGVI